jgi:hypothetical protein
MMAGWLDYWAIAQPPSWATGAMVIMIGALESAAF